MSRKIRIGVLSFAHYHARFWSEVFRDSPLAEFVGIWDEDKTAARRRLKPTARGSGQIWSRCSRLARLSP